MDFIVMDTSKVLETVIENRKKHKEDFLTALNGYKIDCEDKFKKYSKSIKNNFANFDETPVNFMSETGLFNPPAFPSNHLDEYDRVIKMLEMTNQETIELNHNEFRNYIMDQWDWKNNFQAVVSGYALKADSFTAHQIKSDIIKASRIK